MGSLADRYRAARRHRVLALDGGGIRGLLTLQVLQRIEDLLRTTHGAESEFRLSDFFDVIAGTSRGPTGGPSTSTGSTRSISGRRWRRPGWKPSASTTRRAGDIRTDMFQELLVADLVVADLTIDNPNVLYELCVMRCVHGVWC